MAHLSRVYSQSIFLQEIERDVGKIQSISDGTTNIAPSTTEGPVETQLSQATEPKKPFVEIKFNTGPEPLPPKKSRQQLRREEFVEAAFRSSCFVVFKFRFCNCTTCRFRYFCLFAIICGGIIAIIVVFQRFRQRTWSWWWSPRWWWSWWWRMFSKGN